MIDQCDGAIDDEDRCLLRCLSTYSFVPSLVGSGLVIQSQDQLRHESEFDGESQRTEFSTHGSFDSRTKDERISSSRSGLIASIYPPLTPHV